MLAHTIELPLHRAAELGHFWRRRTRDLLSPEQLRRHYGPVAYHTAVGRAIRFRAANALGLVRSGRLDLGDYADADADASWILYGYEPATSTAAARYRQLDLSEPVPQGTGFWFLHTVDTALRLNLPPSASDATGTMGGGCAAGAACIATPLAASPDGDWTIGAVPTTRSPAIDTFRVVTDATAADCTAGCTLDEAADAGYTAPNGVWVYEQSTDNYRLLSRVDSLAPWTGFWLKTEEAGASASPQLLLPVR